MKIYALREFVRDGKQSYVVNLILGDKTKTIRTVLWGEHAQNVDKINRGDILRILSGYIKEGLQEDPELHIGYRGRIIINPEDANTKDFPFVKEYTHKIDGLEANLNDIDIIGVVERVYPISTFQRKDGSEGKRASLILRDDTGSTRIVLWDKSAEIADRIDVGTILRLDGAYTKEGLKNQIEVHGGGRTGVLINPKTSVEFSIGPPEIVNIVDLQPNMRSVDIFVRIMHIGEIREFTTKDGRSGRLITLYVKDTTGDVRTVLWDESVDLVQNANPGDLVLIKNAYTREGLSGETELHVGRLSNVTINPKELEEKGQLISQIKETFTEIKPIPEAAKEYHRVLIKDCKENQFAEVRGTILKLYERNPIYEACPECRRRVKSENNEILCPNCGKIDKSIPRLLLNGILDDGSGNIRFLIIGNEGEKILDMTTEELVNSIENADSPEALVRQFAPKIIGKEIITSGKIIKNEVLDTLELNISRIRVTNTLEEANKIVMHLEE
jgi:ssDNA-binding replication factor A large subunit